MPPPEKHPASPSTLLHDPRVLRLLTFLTRTQAWLTPPQIAKAFRVEGRPVGVATLYRWFAALEETAGLVYFPYPRMNLLGLQEVAVRVHGLRSPQVLSAVPFSHSFLVELGFDGQACIGQDYWVPGAALKAFEEYWRAAVDLDLVTKVDLLPARNTHFLYSPFEHVVTSEGWVEIGDGVDNEYFEALLRKHLREPFETEVAKRVSEVPLLVPLILEHVWGSFSSRHVWLHLQAKGASQLQTFRKGLPSKALRKRGSTLRVLQQQWTLLLQRFHEFFLQPVVFVPPRLFRNCALLSFLVQTGSTDRLVELARRVSENSVMSSVTPEVGWGGKARLWCTTPVDRLPAVVRLARDYQSAADPPALSVVDVEATSLLAEPSFCRFDWNLFDPGTLTWRFDAPAYLERLKELRSRTAVSAGFASLRSVLRP